MIYPDPPHCHIFQQLESNTVESNEMPRISYGEQKYQEKSRHRRGLQKTKYYCQICQRQCIGENGFKCHLQSDSHIKKLKASLEKVHGNSAKLVEGYSNQFLQDFLALLRKTHGEKQISANKFYQEYILNKDHLHLNSTKWNSLTSLINFLAEKGCCRVEEEAANENDEDAEKRYTIAYRDTNGRKPVEERAKNRKLGKTNASKSTNRLLEEQIRRGQEAIKRQEEMKAGEEKHIGHIERPKKESETRGKIRIKLSAGKKTTKMKGINKTSLRVSSKNIFKRTRS